MSGQRPVSPFSVTQQEGGAAAGVDGAPPGPPRPPSIPIRPRSRKPSSRSRAGAEDVGAYYLPSALRVRIFTWNMGGGIPDADLCFLREASPDVVAVAVQEAVHSIAFSLVRSSKKKWLQVLDAIFYGDYVQIGSSTLTAMNITVFVKKPLVRYVTCVQKCFVATGTGGAGNKGCVGLSMCVAGTSMLFVGAHLMPHEENIRKRNDQLARILTAVKLKPCPHMAPAQRGDTVLGSFNYVFLAGDLNYRLAPSSEREKEVMVRYFLGEFPSNDPYACPYGDPYASVPSGGSAGSAGGAGGAAFAPPQAVIYPVSEGDESAQELGDEGDGSDGGSGGDGAEGREGREAGPASPSGGDKALGRGAGASGGSSGSCEPRALRGAGTSTEEEQGARQGGSQDGSSSPCTPAMLGSSSSTRGLRPDLAGSIGQAGSGRPPGLRHQESQSLGISPASPEFLASMRGPDSPAGQAPTTPQALLGSPPEDPLLTHRSTSLQASLPRNDPLALSLDFSLFSPQTGAAGATSRRSLDKAGVVSPIEASELAAHYEAIEHLLLADQLSACFSRAGFTSRLYLSADASMNMSQMSTVYNGTGSSAIGGSALALEQGEVAVSPAFWAHNSLGEAFPAQPSGSSLGSSLLPPSRLPPRMPRPPPLSTGSSGGNGISAGSTATPRTAAAQSPTPDALLSARTSVALTASSRGLRDASMDGLASARTDARPVVLHAAPPIDPSQITQIAVEILTKLHEVDMIHFPPTYKLASDSNKYVLTRMPSWTDRILYGSTCILPRLSKAGAGLQAFECPLCGKKVQIRNLYDVSIERQIQELSSCEDCHAIRSMPRSEDVLARLRQHTVWHTELWMVNGLHCLSYEARFDVMGSDHRPVTALLTVPLLCRYSGQVTASSCKCLRSLDGMFADGGDSASDSLVLLQDYVDHRIRAGKPLPSRQSSKTGARPAGQSAAENVPGDAYGGVRADEATDSADVVSLASASTTGGFAGSGAASLAGGTGAVDTGDGAQSAKAGAGTSSGESSSCCRGKAKKPVSSGDLGSAGTTGPLPASAGVAGSVGAAGAVQPAPAASTPTSAWGTSLEPSQRASLARREKSDPRGLTPLNLEPPP